MLELEHKHNEPVLILNAITTAKDGSSTLFSLINSFSKNLYLPADFVTNPPVAVEGFKSIAGVVTEPLTGNQTIHYRNTRLLLSPRVYKDIFNTPKVSIGFKHETVVFYDRIHISDIPDTTISKGTSLTVYDAFDKLKVKTGLSFLKDDVYNDSLGAADANGMVTVALRIKETSLRYYSSPKVFSGTKTKPGVPSGGGVSTDVALQLSQMAAKIDLLNELLGKSKVKTFYFDNNITWKIKHNAMTIDFVETILSSANERLYAPIKVIDQNEFWIEFTEPEAGSVSVLFEVVS